MGISAVTGFCVSDANCGNKALNEIEQELPDLISC